jgi:hypothetical protein
MSHAETIAWLRGRAERMARDGTDSSDSMSGAELVRQARIEHAREVYEAMGVDWDPEEEFR